MFSNASFVILCLLLISGCGKKNTLKGVFQKKTPYEAYSSALKDANLDRTTLGSNWLDAGAAVFKDSLVITLPYSETAYFDDTEVTANGYRFIAEKGQVVNVEMNVIGSEDLTIFLDLFSLKEEPEHLASSDTSQAFLEYEVEETGTFMLRLQPELLQRGRYHLEITSSPVLAFPVLGKTGKSIASFYGANRDGGRRKHEGVDIFAPRGTPVIAATEGRVGRVNLNNLGGKVIWLRDPERNLSLYYAHLDSQMVSSGQRVKIGDTLGLVGNTGNAITTPPHLHFGIYSAGFGAVDPYPFLHTKNSATETAHGGLEYIGKRVRIKNPLVNFRLTPDLQSEIITKLPENSLLKIRGNSEKWLRGESPENLKGFVHVSMVELIEVPLEIFSLPEPAPLLDYPGEKGVLIRQLESGTSLEILAEQSEFYYVRAESLEEGWIKKLL